eukprot:4591878-Amphidinium_carterae.1
METCGRVWVCKEWRSVLPASASTKQLQAVRVLQAYWWQGSWSKSKAAVQKFAFKPLVDNLAILPRAASIGTSPLLPLVRSFKRGPLVVDTSVPSRAQWPRRHFLREFTRTAQPSDN